MTARLGNGSSGSTGDASTTESDKAPTVEAATFEKVVIRIIFGLWLAFGVVGCTGETSTPIDLRATTTSTTMLDGVPLPDDDPNAEARQQVRDLAEQQCLDDPTKSEGVVRIVEPDSDEVVGELVVDCEEVRAERADEN